MANLTVSVSQSKNMSGLIQNTVTREKGNLPEYSWKYQTPISCYVNTFSSYIYINYIHYFLLTVNRKFSTNNIFSFSGILSHIEQTIWEIKSTL